MMHRIRAGQVRVSCQGPRDPTVGPGRWEQFSQGWKGGDAHVDGFLHRKAVTINGE